MTSRTTRGSAAMIACWGLFVACSAAQAAEITLYEDANFSGAQLTLRGYTPNIAATGFNDRTSSLVVTSGRWELCTDADFKGTCTIVTPGEYPALQAGLNDRISSAREVGSYGDRRGSYLDYGRGSIQLFGQPGCGGRSLQLDADAPSLDRNNFNDRASSVIVTQGTWELCVDANYGGDCRIYGPGRYPDLGYGMAKQLSSARLVRSAGNAPAVISQGVPVAPVVAGARAVLYEERALHGRSLAVSGAVPDLNSASFDRAAHSLYVESGTWVLCREAYFRGGCRTFEPGRYEDLGTLNFLVSSLRPGGPAERAREVPRGVGMELYAEPDFRGEKIGFESDGMDLAQNNFRNRAQSLIVYVGNWELCTDANIKGSCAVFRPGNYPRLGGLNRQVASLRRILASALLATVVFPAHADGFAQRAASKPESEQRVFGHSDTQACGKNVAQAGPHLNFGDEVRRRCFG